MSLWPALLTGALAGAASIPHCMGMCGALCAAVCGDRRTAAAYQLGRLSSYTVLGAVAASLSAALLGATGGRWAGAALSWLMALGLLIAAVRVLVSLRVPAGPPEPHEDSDLTPLRTGKSTPPSMMTRLATRALRASRRHPWLLGFVTALLPCGSLASLALICAGQGTVIAGGVAAASFAVVTGAGLTASAVAGSVLRDSRGGRLVLASVMLVGTFLFAVRPVASLSEPSGDGPASCHTEPSGVVAEAAATAPEGSR